MKSSSCVLMAPISNTLDGVLSFGFEAFTFLPKALPVKESLPQTHLDVEKVDVFSCDACDERSESHED